MFQIDTASSNITLTDKQYVHINGFDMTIRTSGKLGIVITPAPPQTAALSNRGF